MERQSFNFGIESTAEDMGDYDMAESLLSGKSATANPDDVKEIDDEEEVEAPAPPKKKVEVTPKPAPKRPVATEKVETEEDNTNHLLGEEEETADDEETNDADKDPEDTDEDDDSINQFQVIANELAKAGVFNVEEGEELDIQDGQALLDRFEVEKKQGAVEIIDNYLSRFGEEYRQFFTDVFERGVNPRDYMATYNSIQSFKDLDISDAAAQERIVREGLKLQGYEPDDINDEVTRLGNYGDLEAAAKRHHKVLLKKEETKLADMAAVKEKELNAVKLQKETFKGNLQKIFGEKLRTKNFDGIPLTPQEANETFDYLYTDKYKLPNGETITEFDKDILELKKPENHALKAKLGLLLRKRLDLSTVAKTAVKEEKNELFQELASKKKKIGAAPAKPKSWF